jgi:hypothetical protein
VSRATPSRRHEPKSATPPPRLLAQSSPTATPPRSSATSPRTAPSRPPLAKLSPPLGSPAPPRAKAPAHCPRTGPPAANRRRAHWRPNPPRGRPVHSPPSTVTPFPPLRSRWHVGPRQRRHLRAPTPSLALGRSWADALARARVALGWASFLSPGPPELKPFFFFLFSIFSFN